LPLPSCWYPTRLAGQVVEYVAKVELEDQKPLRVQEFKTAQMRNELRQQWEAYSSLSLCERPTNRINMGSSIIASVERQRTRRRCGPREDSELRLRTSNEQVLAERPQKKHTET
jgi:hypothetical protein